MLQPIGFLPQIFQTKEEQTPETVSIAPRKSLVQVDFPEQNTALSYYNDSFDLHCGDFVYVSGKLEGILGRVTAVHYNFKIKPSMYERVLSVVDRSIHGQLFLAGSHCVALDPSVLPAEKIARWFLPPIQTEDYISGSDDSSFPLSDLGALGASEAVGNRGLNYYRENRVKYLCLDGETGYAIVAGGKAYEVDFRYRKGEISALTCTCPCAYPCKHQVAAMLQLRETLELMEKYYPSQWPAPYFAAISKASLFTFAVNPQEQGTICL